MFKFTLLSLNHRKLYLQKIDTGSKFCMICHIESLPSSSTSFREMNKHIFIANIVLIFLMYVKFDTEKINTPKVVQKI